jgi:hypothetical protein
MKATLPLEKMRFASCVRVTRLLQILPEAARRAVDGEAFLILPASLHFNGGFRPSPMNKINLTRHEIFRGKISQRKNQPNQTDLEERTLTAPNP